MCNVLEVADVIVNGYDFTKDVVTAFTFQNIIIKNAGVSLCQIQERYRFLLFQIEGNAQLQMLLWRFLPQGSLIRY